LLLCSTTTFNKISFQTYFNQGSLGFRHSGINTLAQTKGEKKRSRRKRRGSRRRRRGSVRRRRGRGRRRRRRKKKEKEKEGGGGEMKEQSNTT
jgi:hypothetical protein